MLRYTLTLPLQSNNGRSFAADQLRVQDCLVRHFGAFTAQDAVGSWRGTSGVYDEPVRVYTVDVSGEACIDPLLDPLALLTALAQDLKLTCEQEAVYLTRQPVEAFLI